MDPTALFLDEATLLDHHRAQRERRADYVAALLLLLAHRVSLSPGARARALAAAWARRDDALGGFLLDRPEWDLTAVARAVQLLDAGRQARALRRRIARLEAEGRVRPRRLGNLRSALNDLTREGEVGSFSGALARKVRRWVQTIPADKLEYYALTFPLAPWRTLADLCHLAPADFQLPWFLSVAFGAEPPPDTALAACNAATADALPALATRFRIPYSSLRVRVPPAQHPPELRAAIAGYESLDTLLWYHEELACPAVDARITERLQAGEAPDLGYGKLMERLFAARDRKAPFWRLLLPLAERRIARHLLPIDAPVVVLGDASSSMMVAIRVATIIGAVLTVLARADLRFFNDKLIDPPTVPRRIADVLRVTDAIRAIGSTSPAAALWRSLTRRDRVRSFVVVTDEEENTSYKGLSFAEMLERYRREVHPAHVVFISFLDQRSPGQMVTRLTSLGIPCRQFRLDARRPDLTKLDEILGHLSISGELYRERLATVTAWAADAALAELATRTAALLTGAAEAGAHAPPAPSDSQHPAKTGVGGLVKRLRGLLRR